MLKKSTLLFLSVFLLLAFSISPVEAEHCTPSFCDRDGDCFVRAHKRCTGMGTIDCDDTVTSDTNVCDDDGGGGGGGGEKPTVVETTAQWGGVRVSNDELVVNDVLTFRPCVAKGMHPSGSNGSYSCELNDLRTITYRLGVGVPTFGDASFCGVFDGFRLSPPATNIELAPNFKYGYGWNGNCFESGCTIRIHKWFHDMELVPGTGGAHLIVVVADTEPVMLQEGEDKNPFVLDLTLDVVKIDITFSDGPNTLAVCQYSPELDNLMEGDVTFSSFCVGLGCQQ